MMGTSNSRSAIVRFTVALCASASALALTGCDFQLRGSPPVPAALQPLHIACADKIPAELCKRVKTQLDQGGIEIAKADSAAYQLKLDQFEEQRRASAISLDASAAEYEVRQIVTMSIISTDNVPVLADAQIRSSDTYRYDDANVLAKRREEKTLRDQLYTRLAQQVIFRMAPYSSARLQKIRQQYQDEQARQQDAEQKKASESQQGQDGLQ